ncbi:MAG: hypothetical protein ABSG34_12810 [Candidatus Sulfotelmatobacter sp.]|jgi:ferric-dicitrate binding protein FerR (iron transport regulator)
MRVSILRCFWCWTLVLLIPLALLGQEVNTQPEGAILHAQGGVWVNGAEARDSSAIFPGDLIETKAGFSANLTLDGTTILVGQESLVKFQNEYVELDHGTVSIGTSKSFRVHVNCLRVVPVRNEWTQYEVTDVNRTVQVSAHKEDVNVEHEMGQHKPTPESAASQKASVHEGEQHGYDETEICGAPGPVSSAGALSPKWIAVEAGAGAGILCALLCRGSSGSSKSNMSQSSP